MKKYVFNLVLLCIVHNMCAMELDPFDRCTENDEKCQLVARYLHKYPKGKNEKEAKKIEWFLKDELSERVTVLPLYVTKYKNSLQTMDAEEYLDGIYEAKLPVELRKKIFEQALFYSAKEYYVTHNSLQFLSIYHPAIVSRYSSTAIKSFYAPYFLAEIHEEDIGMHFSGLNNNLSEDITTYSIASFVNTASQVVYNRPQAIYQCKIKFIEELIFFLNKKDERLNGFKIMFHHYIEELSQMNEEHGVKRFIFLLERFKGLTKRAVSLYTGRDRLT